MGILMFTLDKSRKQQIWYQQFEASEQEIKRERIANKKFWAAQNNIKLYNNSNNESIGQECNIIINKDLEKDFQLSQVKNFVKELDLIKQEYKENSQTQADEN